MRAAGTLVPAGEKGSHERIFSFLTATIAWVMIVMMSVPANPDYYVTGLVTNDSSSLTRTLWLSIFAIAIVILLLRISLSLRVIRQVNVFFLLFVVLATVSILWSIDAAQTGIRLFRLMVMCAVFLAIAVGGWDSRRFQELIRPPITLLLAGSIVFCLVRPDLAIHHDPEPELFNAWRGLFPTKNALGGAAAFGFILWAHAWLSRETGRVWAILGAFIAAVCLVKSRSSTSTIATFLSVTALVILMRTPGSMRRSVKFLSTALILTTLLYSLAMLKIVPGLDIILAPIPMITGKSLTFSNRADIWAAVLDHVRLRPLLGSGYSAYWSVVPPTPYMESYSVISRLNGFYPGSAHNGYLQILNDLGIVGLLFLLGYVGIYFRQSMRLYSINRSQGALFLGVLFQQATINLSEPLWLNVLLTDFAVMSIATTCIARALLEARSRATPRVEKNTPGFTTVEALRPSHSGPRRSGKPRLHVRYPFNR